MVSCVIVYSLFYLSNMETSNCCRTFPEPELLSPHGTGGADLLCGDDTGDTPFFRITLLREFPELVQSWLLTEFCEELNEDDHELKENLIKKKWNVQKKHFSVVLFRLTRRPHCSLYWLVEHITNCRFLYAKHKGMKILLDLSLIILMIHERLILMQIGYWCWSKLIRY